MANVAHNKQATLVGVRDVVFALLTTDDSTGATYESDIHQVPGVIEIAITPESSSEVLGADDNPVFDSVNSLDSLTVSFTPNALDSEAEAMLMGHTIDDNGVIMVSGNDVAPYVAMGFKSARNRENADRYIWLLKGKFAPSDITFRTKEQGAVNWNTPAYSATFGRRDFDGQLQFSLNTDDTGVDAQTVASFFTQVYQPSIG